MKNNRGRPLGFRLSEESKRAISESKKGQRHSEATKEKISRSLLQYFKLLYPLSKEFYDNYEELIKNDKEVSEWFSAITEQLDSSENFVTEKSLNSKRQREISIELNIDMSDNNNVNAFTTNPEKMCELRMLCEKYNVDLETMLLLYDKRHD